MTRREALYAKLGLVDRGPDPCARCDRGCSACHGSTHVTPDYYKAGQKENEARLAAIAQERERWMADVRLRAERSRINRGNGSRPEAGRVVAFSREVAR